MATGDEAGKSPNTDNQDTSVLGKAPATSASSAGTLLNNRYLLIRQLNAGGFGTVHLAHDQQMHGRPVVVKIQINQCVDDPWFEKKFNEEVRALSLLDHPSVVVAFDSGRTPEGMPFLVMQYVEGETLRASMSPEGMPLERAAGILKQLGGALSAAHEKGIWHRDLKPENIMIQSSSTSEDRVRLIDFGIATVADVKSKYQTSTRVAGSVLYMAPEQTIGQPTALTDIYAMGLIAYEMVTGRRPFPAENAIQMITLQQLPVRVKPSDLRPSLPAAAEQLILQSLDVEPFRRPQNAKAFGDRLYTALTGAPQTIAAFPVMAASTPSVTLPPPPVMREKRSMKPWAFGIAALAILSGTFKEWRKSFDPRPASPSEIATPAKNDDSIELAYWNSVKDSAEPRLYREYLSKYPTGQFASLATAKIDLLTKKTAKTTLVPPPVVEAKKVDTEKPAPPPAEQAVAPDSVPAETGPNARRKLPLPRQHINLADYHGPTQGELHWSGRVLNNGGLMIQAGEVNTGTMSGDLPRVPVKLEIEGTQASILIAPNPKNQWDHITIKNFSGGPMKSLVIHWKVIQPKP